MQERPLQDVDNQPEGHGVCLFILIIVVLIAIASAGRWVHKVYNEPEPVKKTNPFFISPNR